MKELSVWAPQARQVEAKIGSERHALERAPRGWWRLSSPQLQHGDDYAFFLDGEGPFPDPRSPWQPDGPHGSSRYYEQGRYRWKDEGWQAPPLGSAIIYELHIGTFTKEGTYQAAKAKLDHLLELGINYLELMPVAQFEGRHGWGYDGVDLFAPHNAYGSPDELKDFVDTCHAKGLAVLLDVVYNHLGPSGNYLERFGPYFTGRHKTNWGRAVNLDGPGSDEARRFFIDNALMWLRDYHFDGLRLDAVHAFVDTSATHFLEQLVAEVRRLEAWQQRRCLLIAESDLNDPRIVQAQELGGYGMDAQWNEDFHHSLHPLLTGETFGYFVDFGRVADLAKSLGQGQVYSGQYSKFRNRSHGRALLGVNGHRLVGCLQNHDQIGNRGAGERINHLISLEQFKLGAGVALLSPFTPLLFQGEEWATSSPFAYFTDFSDEELVEAIRKGRKEEFSAFGWDDRSIADPQEALTFERSKLNWEERDREPHAEALAWYRSLIRLRRSCPDFVDGRMDPEGVRYDEAARWLVFRRGRFLALCNFSDAQRSIPLPEAERHSLVLSSRKGVSLESATVVLPPYALAVMGPDTL